MKKKVLIIGTSPRLHGNSNRLAKAFAEGAEEAGHDVEFIPMAGKT
ncbi:MAG: NAD(P)H-dependent oxidoreductase, partial [Eubacterium sp.]